MIQTERLTIRHIAPSDWQSIQKIWEDVNTTPFAQYGKIVHVDEYWGDDGEAPQWRQDMHIGQRIQG